jgi:hypothetical protein
MERDPHAETEPAPVGDGAYVAKQGECIYSIAARTGHRWQTLWDHPQNQSLRAARKDPGILLPGDRVFVPELAVKTLTLASGKRHRIVIEEQLVWLRLRMCDGDGEPMAKAKYELCVGDQKIPVETNDEGYFEARVPARLETARLVETATGESFTLCIGHMDPTGSAGAVRKRLANLGYHPGGEEAEMNAALDEQVAVLLDDFREDAALDGDTSWDARLRQLEGKEPWTA